MDQDVPPKTQPTIEQQKRMLIAQGALYRLAIAESKLQVLDNMHVDLIARNALAYVTGNSYAALGKLFGKGGLKGLRPANFTILLPLLAPLLARARVFAPLLAPILGRGISGVLRRRHLARPLAIGSGALVAAGAAVFLVLRWRKVRQEQSMTTRSYP